MEFDFEKILKISLTALRINRCHPEIPKNLKWATQIILGHIIYFIPCIAIFYSVFWINLRQNDFSEACRNGIFFVTCSAVTMKYFIMFRYGNIILSLFKDMQTDLEVAKNLPEDEQIVISENAAKESDVCKQWLLLAMSSCGSFHAKMILLNLYNYIIGEGKIVNLYDLICPKAIEARKDNNIYIFSFIYFVMFYYGVYSAVIYVAFVPLGPVFMLHASAQLVLVRKRVESLYLDEASDREINDKLRDIIKHLQRIYDFVGRVSTCMTVFYEVTLKVSSIVLPVTLFEIIKSFKSGNPSFEFTMFLFTALISSSSPCYYGDLLLEKIGSVDVANRGWAQRNLEDFSLLRASRLVEYRTEGRIQIILYCFLAGEEVRQAVYACGWERKYERSTRRTLLLFLQRASQPINISTMFRNVCLDALTDVFRQAYAIFSLINTVWE